MGLNIEFKGRNKDRNKEKKPSFLSRITLKVWIFLILVILLLFYPSVLMEIYFVVSTFVTNQLMSGI